MFVPEVRHFVPTVSIVGDDYCYPYLVDLAVHRRVDLSSKYVCAMDGNGSPLMQVVGGVWQLKKKRTMYNSLGEPIITMRRKALPWHQEWKVYRGEGSNHLLYIVQKPHSFQLKTKLQVFLSTNSSRECCDFLVVGSYTCQSFKVYRGESDIIVAEVKEKSKLGRIGKESFQARIYPGIDYAFIMSLLVIVNEMDI